MKTIKPLLLITFFGDIFSGASAGSTYVKLASALKRNGIEAVMVFYHINNQKVPDAIFIANKDNFINRLIFPFLTINKIGKIISTQDISLIHQVSFPFEGTEGYNLLFLRKYFQKPFIIGPLEEPHSLTSDDYARIYSRSKHFQKLEFRFMHSLVSLTRPFFKFMSMKNLKDSDAVLVVSEATKRHLIKINNDVENKITIIPYGVDVDLFSLSPPKINHEIVIVGSLIDRKGHCYLIDAMIDVVSLFPMSKLKIVGDGPLMAFLTKKIVNLRLQNNVVFYGRIANDEVIRIIQDSRIMVSASVEDSFCHTILEGMACGRPIVSTRTSGSFMVKDGKNGYLVPIKNSQALSEAIIKLFNNDILTINMSIESRKEAETYSWDNIAKQYNKLYERVLGNSS
jgi:glycosyltransferase involved in cell wall biosynthesis